MNARLLREVKGVEAVHIEEKDFGFCAYVLGGEDQQIAETIWQHKPLGVHTYGDIACEITASNGQSKMIRFSRPKTIELSLHLDLKVIQNLDDFEFLELTQVATY
jgi:hypothetical protein